MSVYKDTPGAEKDANKTNKKCFKAGIPIDLWDISDGLE